MDKDTKVTYAAIAFTSSALSISLSMLFELLWAGSSFMLFVFALLGCLYVAAWIGDNG